MKHPPAQLRFRFSVLVDRPSYGSLQKIHVLEYVDLIDKSPKDVPVIIHLYQEVWCSCSCACALEKSLTPTPTPSLWHVHHSTFVSVEK